MPYGTIYDFKAKNYSEISKQGKTLGFTNNRSMDRTRDNTNRKNNTNQWTEPNYMDHNAERTNTCIPSSRTTTPTFSFRNPVRIYEMMIDGKNIREESICP